MEFKCWKKKKKRKENDRKKKVEMMTLVSIFGWID